MDATQPTQGDTASQADSGTGRQFAQQLWAATEIALTGVQQGKPHTQILEQLHRAGVSPQDAENLVRYARDVELLNTAGVIAGEGVRLGKPSAEIVDHLRRLGVDDVIARGIEARVRENHQQSQMRTARRLLIAGVAWLAGAALLAISGSLLTRHATLVLALLLLGGTLQLLYGWHRRNKALRIRRSEPC